MSDSDSVRRALRRFAARSADDRHSQRDRSPTTDAAAQSYQTVIDEAAAATATLSGAATFAVSGGLDRLDAAIDRAAAAGDDAAARRGEDVLATFRAFSRACDGERAQASGLGWERDHFRSGRGTTLGTDTQVGDE